MSHERGIRSERAVSLHGFCRVNLSDRVGSSTGRAMLSRWRLTIIHSTPPEQSRSSSLSTRISIPLSHLTFVLTVRYYSQHGAVLVVVLRPVRLTDELVRRRPCGTMRMGAAARGSLPRSCKRFRGQDVETRSRRAPAGRSGGVGPLRAPRWAWSAACRKRAGCWKTRCARCSRSPARRGAALSDDTVKRALTSLDRGPAPGVGAMQRDIMDGRPS